MKFASLLLMLAAAPLGACSTEQWYDTAQHWQRNQCQRVPDSDTRNQCEARTKTPYDSYNEARDKAAAH